MGEQFPIWNLLEKLESTAGTHCPSRRVRREWSTPQS
ncbi:ANK_REP_REGION domain-containing protein [Psidium guajava]|nr:ANK_REP_REGION domain-containing protein [Psidium guajava]